MPANSSVKPPDRDDPPVHYVGIEETYACLTKCGRPTASAYERTIWENEVSDWRQVTCLDCLKLRAKAIG